MPERGCIYIRASPGRGVPARIGPPGSAGVPPAPGCGGAGRPPTICPRRGSSSRGRAAADSASDFIHAARARSAHDPHTIRARSGRQAVGVASYKMRAAHPGHGPWTREQSQPHPGQNPQRIAARSADSAAFQPIIIGRNRQQGKGCGWAFFVLGFFRHAGRFPIVYAGNAGRLGAIRGRISRPPGKFPRSVQKGLDRVKPM